MLIELHAIADNAKIWVNPTKIMLVTFQEGTTTLMLEGGIAMQVVESMTDLRLLLDQVVEYESAIIVAQSSDY